MRRLLIAVLLLTLACEPLQRAKRYPPLPAPQTETPLPPVRPPELPAHWSWLEPSRTPDIPIVFVPDSDPHWQKLPEFWNHFPPPAAGMRTIHVGQHPFAIAAGMALADQMEVIRIKVPLGLPDPRPHIPAVNPPTYAKWKLGKMMFHDATLLRGSIACASCHRPDHGFSMDTKEGVLNPPTLINCVYNRHQFRDGRVTALEEVIVRQLDDESETAKGMGEHVFGGMVTALQRTRAKPQDPDYRVLFGHVFGIEAPTQDTIAKALATYMRTILAGDSLVDRAAQKDRSLNPEAFLAVLTDDAAEKLGQAKRPRKEVAAALAHGQRVFGQAGCAGCHPSPLYTDHDFHNLGVGDSSQIPQAGKETGRFARVPIGLKEGRFIGAVRTPTLRALPRTAPYFHDGSKQTLGDAIDYLDGGIPPSLILAAPFRAPDGSTKRLYLNAEEKGNLELFLRALNGTPGTP